MRSHPLTAALVVAACGAPAPAPAVVPSNTPVDPGAEAPASAKIADPSCVADCVGRYPEPRDPAGIGGYCDELCVPTTEPSATCMASCARRFEPSAYYDEQGEYQVHRDDRSADEIASVADRCATDCAETPDPSPTVIRACVEWCVDSGLSEERCWVDCDPDPFDECRYLPCD